MTALFDRAAWLAERKTGIGASDAPAICGVSPWSTALGVYLEKTGQLTDDEETAPKRWGLKLEEAIAEAYCEANPGTELAAPKLARHSLYPYMLATIDRISDSGRIVELKTANQYTAGEWGDTGTDQIPEAYIVQVQHQIEVANHAGFGDTFEEADVAVLIGGQDFRVYTVRRNERLIHRLLEIEADFWGRVQRRDAPAPDWKHGKTPDLIASMYGFHEAEEITLDAEAETLWRQYQTLGAEEKAAKEDRKMVKARLLERIKTAGIVHFPSGAVLTRKQISVEERTQTVRAYSYPDLRERKTKKVQARS